MSSNNVLQPWDKLVADMNADSGYVHGHAAAVERARLEAIWRDECPGLAVPEITWSSVSGRYELTEFNRLAGLN